MKSDWAEENLQTIRTLMERSAVYRRALAPIMLFAGTMGVLAAIGGLAFHLDTTRAFGMLWLGTAVAAVMGSFTIARQQSLIDKEAFWSSPTRRVAQALLPPLTAGLSISLVIIIKKPEAWSGLNLHLTLLWILFYGCALHAAGFFMPRGVKWFGWAFVSLACFMFALLWLGYSSPIVEMVFNLSANWLMGFFFGGLHLSYGVYLYLTEKKIPVA